ncbi:hypothetical protein H4O18_15375 [Arenibacter sp. BSSL-BM3]|uniref:Molecular chaperone n=1 Tax=Arenibacter arenosicollis TaxID=2762274 RepID=A0ABR7QQ99_9FLAO|nr:hypothetical protein [Arenibacter arenosicollis]MBC8769377.1 hypothetical protein [Arenibacter arenosicollis]
MYKRNLMPFLVNLSKDWICAVMIISTSLSGYAQGDLLIFPKRIVFDGNHQKVKKVYVTNNGIETTTYKISYIELDMDKEGKLVELDTIYANQNIASKKLRIYPRHITLLPGESQVVKVQLINERNIAEGEYRSHLYFRSVPNPKNPEERGSGKASDDNISIKLNYVYGISIANIIRVGNPNIQVNIESFKVENIKEQYISVSMSLERNGNFSSYGNIEFEYISPNGKIIHLKTIKGFAVYAPGNLRQAHFGLNTLDGLDLNNGKIRATYKEEGNERIYAQETLNL